MYSEFATDPKIQMLDEKMQRRYLMLLCLRCSNDDVTLHDDEVAFQLRISNDEYITTKGVLVSKGLIGEDNKPTAWDKRQFTSDSSASRVAKHRARKKQECNVTETKSNALDTDTDTDTDTDIKEKKKKEKIPRVIFKPPSPDEIQNLSTSEKLNLTGFFDYYESNGWQVGKNKMKNWQAAARGWHKRQVEFKNQGQTNAGNRQLSNQESHATVSSILSEQLRESVEREMG